MPTYSYECPKCHLAFTETVPVANRFDAVCLECGVPAMLVITGPINFHKPPWADKPVPDSVVDEMRRVADKEGRELTRMGRED